MKERLFEEEKVYSLQDVSFTHQNYENIRKAIRNNYAVGFLTGIYDDALTITNVSGFLLHNLGYTVEQFVKESKGSLKELFHGENTSFLEINRFKNIHGEGEGSMRTRQGVPVNVRMLKMDSIDETGQRFWILSVQMDWMQQNLHLVNETIHSGFWYIDCDGQGQSFKYVYSHEFRRMLGYHDILDFPNCANSWLDLIHPEDKKRVEEQLEMAIQSDRIKYDVEYRMYVKDKGYQWFKDSAKVIRRLDGTCQRMVGIFINIEKNKQAQKKQQRSDAFHRAYTTANLSEYYIDLEEGTFETMKDYDSLLEEYESDLDWNHLVQQYVQEYVLEEYKDSISHMLDLRYIQEKISEGQKEVNFECEIFVHGQKRWVRNVVICDEDPRYVIVFIRDITKAKEEAYNIQLLTQQNKIMDLLIQGTTKLVDGYAMCDFEHQTYQFYGKDNNPSLYKASGMYDEFILEIAKHYKTIESNMKIEEAFSIQKIQEELKDSSSVYRFEYCSLSETQFKSVSITPISFKEGNANLVLFMSQDTTQEKVAEIASRKFLKEAYETANKASLAKTQFLSNMSHDIRTPMNAIVGMTAIASAHIENPEKVMDCLAKITQSSRHLLALINEILDMSRIESGKITLSEEEFNLSQLVDTIVSINKPSMDMHQHHFDVKIGHIEHEDVCGDSLRLQQMINNILVNAMKYTPDQGNIVLSISEIETQSNTVGCFEFVIQDDGIGMSKEFQKVMFEPFTREDSHRTSKIQGTGLGMTIARNFAQMMNGDIQVESTPGKGSTFTITVSLKLQNKKMESLEDLIHFPVLVVDDDLACCENTVHLLKEIGIDGEYVTSGKMAIQKTLQKPYFALIIDWKMPQMDGVQTAREIRKIVGKDVTIIILSAFDYSQIEEEARLAGVDAFIAKPLFRSRLTATLKSVVEGKPNGHAKEFLADLKDCDYSNKNILLVEDNDLNCAIAKEILEMSKVHVEIAHNGKEALDKIAKSKPYTYDLVFMDIQMPIMNGYKATMAIRQLNREDIKTLPIVAMTANAFAQDVALAKNAGMNEHISKPLDMNRLYGVLQKYLY